MAGALRIGFMNYMVLEPCRKERNWRELHFRGVSLVTTGQNFCQGLPSWGQGLGTEKKVKHVYRASAVLDTVGDIGVIKKTKDSLLFQ